MTTAPDAVAATADLCPECGYDRRASGAGRPCSECGYEQPADELVAWGRSHIDTRGGWRPLLPALFMVPMFVLLEALRDSLNGWGFLAVVGVAVGLADWWKRTRPRPATAGPQQLRLSPRGFAVRTGFGASRVQAVEARLSRPPPQYPRRLAGGRRRVAVRRPDRPGAAAGLPPRTRRGRRGRGTDQGVAKPAKSGSCRGRTRTLQQVAATQRVAVGTRANGLRLVESQLPVADVKPVPAPASRPPAAASA